MSVLGFRPILRSTHTIMKSAPLMMSQETMPAMTPYAAGTSRGGLSIGGMKQVGKDADI